MSNPNASIIIKRKKVISGDGHHGGAWKVAYADFVTAMMAFFMLMWLLNATTEQQRKGLADYFAPTIALSRTSGGGADLFAGPSLHSTEGLSQEGTGSSAGLRGAVPMSFDPPDAASGDGEGAIAAEVAALHAIEEVLLGRGGESMVSEQALRHVVTRLSDEGLTIEIFALPGAPIFEPGSVKPLPVTRDLLRLAAEAASIVTNAVAVGAHLPARPVVRTDNAVWGLSTGRADAVRRGLEADGLEPSRLRRVTGHGDRSPAVQEPTAIRNDRIEITLLRRHGSNGLRY